MSVGDKKNWTKPLCVFNRRMKDCENLIVVGEYLDNNYRLMLKEWIRYIYVHSISSLDFYIKELILFVSRKNYANFLYEGNDIHIFTSKILNERLFLKNIFKIMAVDDHESVQEFLIALNSIIRHKSFQDSSSIADGLSYIYDKKDKWKYIHKNIKKIDIKYNLDVKQTREMLDNIKRRRDLIVHNADYKLTNNFNYLELNECDLHEAKIVSKFITKVAISIDMLFWD